MKILICSSTFDAITHGPSKFVNNLWNDSYLKENTEIRIITRDIETSIPGKIYKYDYQLPRVFGSLWEFKENQIFYQQIRNLQHEFQPDFIVFINALMALQSLKALNTSAKVVGFINDDEKLLAGKQFPLISKERIHALKSRFLEKRASERLDAIITNSKYITQFVKQEYHVPSDKIHTLYKGINLLKFKYLDRSNIDFHHLERIKVLFVKSDFERGGLHVLWESLNQLKQFRFILTICGNIDPEKLNFNTENSNTEIDFKGATQQDDVLKLLYACHILCIPALREGLGVANVEGLATGIPVVSTRAGGIVEVLGNGQFGWLAEPNNSKDLAMKLEDCINSRTERLQKSKEGRKHVEEHFDREVMAMKFYKILNNL